MDISTDMNSIYNKVIFICLIVLISMFVITYFGDFKTGSESSKYADRANIAQQEVVRHGR